MLRRLAGAAAVAAALAVTPVVADQARALTGPRTGANPAISSGLGCDDRTTYTPFTAWGDTNPYFLVHGGDFEDPATLWSGQDVYGTAENEPWQVGGDTDSSAAVLDRTGSMLMSPAMCMRDNEPTMRFFYRSPGIRGSKLVVTMRTTSATGASKRTFRLDGSEAGWRLSPPLSIIDLTDATGTQRFTVDFTSAGGRWLVDDVYVDPWKFTVS